MGRIELANPTTDVNGVVGFEYDGTSAGELEIRAFNNQGISSDAFHFFDCIFYDPAIEGNTNDSYYLSSSSLTRTLEADGTIVENTDTTSSRYYCSVPPDATVTSLTGSRVYNGNYQIEIDILEITGSPTFQINGGITASRSLSTYGDTPFTARFRIIDGKAYRESGDNWIEFQTSTSTDDFAIRLGFGTGTSLKFKNWRIYEI